MKLAKLNLLLAVGLVLLLVLPAQSQFVKTLGGSGQDYGLGVTQTSDGGCVVVGETTSFGAGFGDVSLVKFDAAGNLLWMKTLGGESSGDIAYSVIQTSDAGLVVTGRRGEAGSFDAILAKFDSSGNHMWTKAMDERGQVNYVIETHDGGIVGAGSFHGGASYIDFLLGKFDSTGNLLWSVALGASGYSEDAAASVTETSDGGFVVTGISSTLGAGGGDLILAKFDSTGSFLWAKTLGGNSQDCGRCVIQTFDGGLVVTGLTESFGAGDWALLLSKFDSAGNHLWTRTLGGSAGETGNSVIQTSEGGFVVTGYTWSFGEGSSDLLLAKFDASGNHLWTRTLGGSGEDWARSVTQTSDGGLVATGTTHSFGAGGYDLLLARFDASGNTCLGEFVTPTITSPSPTITTPTPTVTPLSPTVSSPSLTVTSPAPTLTVVCDETLPSIVSVADVGNDQGRQVRVKWDRCYWDKAGSPITITEYGLWRRIDEDKGGYLADLGVFDGGRVYPPGDWDFIKTVPARGESTYSAVCPTLGDSTQAEGMYWSVFFVSAMTVDPLAYFDSDPDSGYSLDNIPPLPILDLEIDPDSWFTLVWSVPGEYEEQQPISAYDIRYSTEPVGADTQAWWDNALVCTGDGFFSLTVGEKDSFRVSEETGCHPELYFAIKGLDDRPNASGISNVVHFLCGDDNGDGIVNVGDIVYEVCYLFRNGPAPSPRAAGDVNCDGIENLGDIVYKVSYLYRGGPPPCGQ
jgi:hypothetical protein